jgi:hypothetical protein
MLGSMLIRVVASHLWPCPDRTTGGTIQRNEELKKQEQPSSRKFF